MVSQNPIQLNIMLLDPHILFRFGIVVLVPMVKNKIDENEKNCNDNFIRVHFFSRPKDYHLLQTFRVYWNVHKIGRQKVIWIWNRRIF